MRICVTGCAGFIGSHVAARALDAGYSVVGIDNLSADYDVRLKEWRLGHLQGRPGFRFCRLDLTDRAAVDRQARVWLAAGETLSAIVHLAGQVGLRRSLEDPAACYESNIDGTLHLLELCLRTDIPRVVLASSAAVYGRTLGDTGAGLDDGTRRYVDSPYAASKRAAEEMVCLYHDAYGIDAVIARLFTVYGPAGHPEMSVFRFVRAIGAGEPVEIYGDGNQRRDFTYVGDAARGLLDASRLPGFHVLDLGTGTPTGLLEVVEVLGEIMGRVPIIRHLPAHPIEPADLGASVGGAREALNWVATTQLSDGLRHCVRWFEENRRWVTSLDLGAPYRTPGSRPAVEGLSPR